MCLLLKNDTPRIIKVICDTVLKLDVFPFIVAIDNS